MSRPIIDPSYLPPGTNGSTTPTTKDFDIVAVGVNAKCGY
jgi:hypothetical protein